MGNELRSSGHTVGETNLHLQFTPAYRRDVFSEPLTKELTVAYIIQRSQEMKIEIAASSVDLTICICSLGSGRTGRFQF